MTLLVALRAEDGLVLAADSRGTFGDPRGVTAQNDSQQKARVLTRHVAVLQAGAGELGTNILARTQAALAGSISVIQQAGFGIPGMAPPAPTIQNIPPTTPVPSDGVTPVLTVLRDVTRASYQEWFPSVPAVPSPVAAQTGQSPVRPGLEFIVAGYEVDGESVSDPLIYSMQSALDFAPARHDYGFAVAGVPTYALYLLNRLYQPGRSLDALTSLAVYVITETASQDGKVGGPVSVVQVDADQGCRVLDAHSVAQISAANVTRSDALRDSFYESGEMIRDADTEPRDSGPDDLVGAPEGNDADHLSDQPPRRNRADNGS